MNLLCVFYDMDGVISDSLPAHLDYCDVMNREYKCNLKKPKSPEEISSVIGIPMTEFFKNYGFPEKLIPKLDWHYNNNFGDMYNIPAFRGAEEMLAKIKKAGIEQVVVTSNFAKNAKKQLGKLEEYFSEIYTKESERGKAGNILYHMAIRKLMEKECCLVGDSHSDISAAKKTGVHFVGVEWGWLISAEQAIKEDFDSCFDFADLTDYLISLKHKN